MTHIPARQPEGVPTGGQFAAMTKSEAPGVSLTAASEPDITAMAEALDELRVGWGRRADLPTATGEHLDRTMQHSSVQLAAAVVRRNYPGARALVIRENQDGEDQYDMHRVLDEDGNDIESTADDSTWIYEEIDGEGSSSLGELSWVINVQDDTWAGGIAEIHESKYYGKVATIDIDAAIAKPAPPRPGSKADLLERHAASGERVAAARRQYRAARDADQHAAVQLAAASILERYPGADTLHLAENTDEPGGAMNVISVSGPGGEIAHCTDGDDFHLEPGADGTPELEELLRDLDTSSMAWNEGISTVYHDKFNGYRVALDLKAALAKPAPVIEE